MPDIENEFSALLLNVVPGAVDFHLSFKALTHAGNHIGNQRPHCPVQLLALAVLRIIVFDDYFAAGLVNAGLYAGVTVHLEASERPGDVDRKALQLHHNTLWDFNRFFSDATHLANRTKNFAAQIGLTAVPITHYALTCGNNSNTHTAHDTRQIANGGIDPATRLARSLFFTDDKTAVPVVLQGNPEYS